jgi:hypothetical protein
MVSSTISVFNRWFSRQTGIERRLDRGDRLDRQKSVRIDPAALDAVPHFVHADLEQTVKRRPGQSPFTARGQLAVLSRVGRRLAHRLAELHTEQTIGSADAPQIERLADHHRPTHECHQAEDPNDNPCVRGDGTDDDA